MQKQLYKISSSCPYSLLDKTWWNAWSLHIILPSYQKVLDMITSIHFARIENYAVALHLTIFTLYESYSLRFSICIFLTKSQLVYWILLQSFKLDNWIKILDRTNVVYHSKAKREFASSGKGKDKLNNNFPWRCMTTFGV